MNVTPLNLRDLQFRTAFRGYACGEVDALLTAVADDYEQAIQENNGLRETVTRLHASLEGYREREQDLVTVTEVRQETLSEMTEAHAHRILLDAESQADQVLQDAQERLQTLQREIDTMRMRRRSVERSLEITIGSLQTALTFVRTSERSASQPLFLGEAVAARSA